MLRSSYSERVVSIGRGRGYRLANVPDPETVAVDLTCAGCGRSPRPGELWRLKWIDIREAATSCPECAEQEFGPPGSEDGSTRE
jgi:hypothetical protein